MLKPSELNIKPSNFRTAAETEEAIDEILRKSSRDEIHVVLPTWRDGKQWNMLAVVDVLNQYRLAGWNIATSDRGGWIFTPEPASPAAQLASEMEAGAAVFVNADGTRTATLLPTYVTHVVPSYAHFEEERLIEATLEVDGKVLSSGWCRTADEACARLQCLKSGTALPTEMPDYQASLREMKAASNRLKEVGIRDGGMCAAAVEAAIKAGPNTTDWANASRYLVARWV
jgi:hypothetical protein